MEKCLSISLSLIWQDFEGLAIAEWIVMILLGAALCFLGYRCFRLLLTLLGAIGGAILGDWIYGVAGKNANFVNDNLNESTIHLIFVLLFAVILAILACVLYKKALILITMVSVCFVFCMFFTTFSILTILIGLGLGIIAGFAVFYLQRWAIIITTSAMGAIILANYVTDGITLLLGNVSATIFLSEAGRGSFIWYVLLAFFVISGISFQAKSTKDAN